MKPQINDTGIHIQTFEEIFEELAEGYRGIYGQSISIESDDPDGQRIGIDAKARLDLQQLAVSVRNSLDPDFDDGLLIVSKLSGLRPKMASLSQWDLTVTVDRDLELTTGYTVIDELDQEWHLTAPVTLVSGVNVVTFLAKELGKVEGAESSIVNPVTIVRGVTSITAGTAAIEGRNEETPVELRQRRELSLQNPSYSLVGTMFAKLADLDGVSDLVVRDNDKSTTDIDTGLPANSIYAVVEGGRVADIVEVFVKQKTTGCRSVGDILTIYNEELVRPDGSTMTLPHRIRFDRPEYVDVYVKLKAESKILGQPIDVELIKKRISEKKLRIHQSLQAGELYEEGYKAGDSFIMYGMQISIDDVTYTNEIINPALNEKLVFDVARIDVEVVT